VKPVDLHFIQSLISNFHIKNAIPLQDSVVLIFPGAAGPDSSTQLLKDRILKSDEKNGNPLRLLTFIILNFVFKHGHFK
jgi:hypothetical protein